MKKILVLFFLISQFTVAQQEEYQYSFDRYISDSIMNNLPYGVYRTHQEFLNGRPSISNLFEIHERSPYGQMSVLQLQPKVLRVLDTSSNEMKRFYGTFWCAFDGNEMYLLKDFVIYKLKYLGRFNTCWSQKWRRTYYSYPTATGTYYAGSRKRQTSTVKMVDFKTNEWYPFSKRGMKKLLLANNTFLYKKFISEKRKKHKLMSYLKRLNGIKVAGW